MIPIGWRPVADSAVGRGGVLLLADAGVAHAFKGVVCGPTPIDLVANVTVGRFAMVFVTAHAAPPAVPPALQAIKSNVVHHCCGVLESHPGALHVEAHVCG